MLIVMALISHELEFVAASIFGSAGLTSGQQG